MKLNIILSLVFTSLISFSSIAQVDGSKVALLELENQLYNKKFSKKWNKLKKKEWEEKCNSAKSIEELNALFNEYSDLMAQLISFSMGNSDAKNQLEFAEYLLKVNSILTEDVLSDFDADERLSWKLQLEEIIHSEQYKKEKEQQLQKFLKLSQKLNHFKKNAPEIIMYSEKSALNSLKVKSDFLNNGVAAECTYRFEKDTAGKLKCIMNYNTGGDPLMANKLVLEFNEALDKGIYPNHKDDVVIKILSDTDHSVEVTFLNSIKAN